VSNKHVSLKYDVEHSHDVLLVSQMTALVGIECTQEGGMSLYLDAAQSSDFHVLFDALRSKPVLSGGREWQCVFPENDENGKEVRWTVKTIQRRVVEVSDVKLDGPHLVVQLSTEAAGLNQVFKNAKMSFETSAFPPSTEMHDQSDSQEHRQGFESYRASFEEAHAGGRRAELQPDHASQDQVGWWPFSAITRVVKDFVGLAKKVADVVQTVVHVAVAIATGTDDYDDTTQLASIGWNYDANAKDQVNRSNWELDDSVTCVACFTHLDVGFHMDLHIQNWELQSTAAWIEGKVTSKVDMNLRAEARYDNSNDVVMATIPLPPIHIMIGEIPMVINVTIPVHAGYTFDLDVSGSIRATGSMDGDAKYGFQYLPKDQTATGGFQYIHSHSFEHTGAITSSEQVTAQVVVYVMPVVNIQIDHIGGPNIAIKGFVEPIVAFESESQCSRVSPPGPAGKYTLNWGLQVTIGAFLDITLGKTELLKHQWGPEPIFHIKWEVASGCLQLSDALPSTSQSLALIQPYNLGDQMLLFEGVAYSGQIHVLDIPGCQDYLSIVVHFQLANNSGIGTQGLPVWTSQGPHNWKLGSSIPDASVNVGCVSQSSYINNMGTFEVMYIPPGKQSVDYKDCTLNATKEGYTVASLGGKYFLNSDWSEMTIQTNTQCIGNVTLSRKNNGYRWGH